MSTFQVVNPFQQFFGLDGLPLTSGYVYIGTAGGDPESSPIPVYSDQALTIPLSQPLRTIGGYLANGSAPTQAYVGASPYSMRVRNAAGSVVYYQATAHDGPGEASATAVAAVAALATGNGSGLGFKRPEAGTVQESIYSVLVQYVSVKSWQVAGTNTVSDTAKIQTALDEAPLGCTLFFPPGLYAVNDTIVVRRGINLKFARGAVVLGKLTDSTKNIWEWKVATPPDGAGDVRLLRVEDMEIGGIPGFSQKHTIHIENALPMASNLGMDFVGGSFSAADDQSGVAVHIEGLVTQLHKFWGSQIINGAYLDQCSDAIRFITCEFFGVALGCKMNLQVGAFRTAIDHCVMVCQNGAIQIDGGSEVDITYNQIEQYPVANASTFNSLVAIAGSSFKCRRNNISFNNFGGGGFVNRNIYLDGDTAETFIDNNTFGVTAAPLDVLIASTAVKWTRIGPNNYTRGSGRGGNIETPPGSGLYPVNTSDVDDLLAVLDGGTGTYGARRVADASFAGLVPGIGLSNGWTAATNFMFEKNLNNRVMFRGRLNPGTVTSGTVVATMPVGFRPDDLVFLLVPTSTGVYAVIEITYAGVMSIFSCPPAAALDFNSVTYLAKHEGYDPGV
jgi:hypothetical protein